MLEDNGIVPTPEEPKDEEPVVTPPEQPEETEPEEPQITG